MYLRAVHAEFDVRALREFVKKNPLGILVTAIPADNFPTIQCTHLPWLLDVQDDESPTELGRLRGHMARNNPHSKALMERVLRDHKSNGPLEHEVSVIFNGPVESYVTPKFYKSTKPATGKVVPTWNYSAVQVYGKATILFDAHEPETSSYLQQQIEDLTRHSEESIMHFTGKDGRPGAWEVSDAPTSFIDIIIKKSIIGITIDVDRLEGKYKMSQEMSKEDRDGVIEGFQSLNTEHGAEMARTVEARGALKDTQARAK